MNSSYPGIYDFELLPYALGDVLTWNVQSAVAAHKAGRKRVDIHICLDARFPASIYQRDIVNQHNCGLFLNELFGAFGTHPLLGDIAIYHDRDRLLARLHALSKEDDQIFGITNYYNEIIKNKSNVLALSDYFMSQIHSHEALNDFAAKNGFLPQLHASAGCMPDIEALLAKLLAGRRVVVIHPRFRRLDHGYGGGQTFSRDSDMLEWMAFIQNAQRQRPDVQFIVMGRLQEKPLALLEQPNVMSLRSLGLGLGHELTLFLKADLFLGASSGFAAMANFCEIPYFITKMNPASCKAYAIADGAKALPFAHPHQELIYEDENAEILMELLKRGLDAKSAVPGTVPVRSASLNPQEYEEARWHYLGENASTSRYFADDLAIDAEAAYLLWPKMRAGFMKLAIGKKLEARNLARRIEKNFPRLYQRSELVQSLSADRGSYLFISYLYEELKEYVRGLNASSLPPWSRNRLVLIPARWLKRCVLRRR